MPMLGSVSTAYNTSSYNLPAGGDPFATDLYAYWKFNGDATDAVGNADLTAINSPGYVTGLVFPQAIRLVQASGQYTRNTSVDLSPSVLGANGVFSFQFWIYWTTFATTEYIMVGGSATNAAGSWAALRKDATTNKITAWISNGTGLTAITSALAVSTGAWTSIWLWHEDDGVPRLMIDDRADEAGATMTGALNEASSIYVGWSSFALNGDMGPVAYWPNKFFSRAERLDYYNSGSGVPIVV